MNGRSASGNSFEDRGDSDLTAFARAKDTAREATTSSLLHYSFMPLRPFFLVALALFSLGWSARAQAQNDVARGVLPSRGLSYRLTLARYGTSRAPVAPATHALRLPLLQASRPPQWNTPVTSIAARPIALGAYFYQDGQCAPGDNDAVSAWCARTGRMPAVWMIYQSWKGWNSFPVAAARRANALGGRLLVTWEPWNGGNTADPGWNCAVVASGAQDDYIRRYARAVKAVGVPILLRFAHEMNGDWYPWSVAYEGGYRRHNGNTPQSYVAMWRRVVSLFRQEGAYNASWVWSPNIHYLNSFNTVASQNADLNALYPGDGWVDWIGLSVYNDGSRRPWRSFASLFDGAYQTVTQLSARPLMIAELGATEQGAPYGQSKAQWISQTLLGDIPARYPRVRLVNWFCRDKTSYGEANYRFDSSPDALQAFRVAVNSPLYAGRLSPN